MNALTPSDLYLMEVVLKGTLLLAAAFALAFVLQRASAATRHAVWSLAFIGLLLLPFCAAFLPSWQVHVPGFSAIEALLPTKNEPRAVTIVPEPLMQVEVGAKSGAGFSFEYVAPVQPAPAPPDGATGDLFVTATAAEAGTVAWPWTRVAMMLWVGGAIALLIRLALVLSKLSFVSRRAEPVTDPEWIELTEVLSEVLDIRRPVRLLQHEEIVVPMTYGVRRPVILLPVHAHGWSEDQKHVTLMHELLHVQRYDHLIHILALSARALHWFNPLAWTATKRLLVERERACDDGVLAMGVASTSYADHLLGMARYVLTGQEASAGALAMARPSELRSRIVAILDPGQRRHSLTRLRAFGMAVCALLLIVPLAAMQPGSSAAVQQSYVDVVAPVDAAAPIGIQASPDVLASMPDVQVEIDGEALAESIDDMLDGLRDLEDLASLKDLEALESLGAQEALDGLKALENLDINFTTKGVLDDTSEVEMQRRAVHAIAQLPREQSIPLLIDIARTHRIPEIRAEAIFWLGDEGDPSVADLLEDFARNDANPEIQQRALFALSELDGRTGISHLADLARTHANAEMRAEALFWLSQEGGPEVVTTLEEFALGDENPDVQKKAIFGLSELDNGAGLPSLATIAKTHPNPEARAEAVFWLGEEGGASVADALETFARSDANKEVQAKALFALSELGEAGVPHLINLAKTHPDAEMRSEAIFWLSETGDPRAAEALLGIVQDH